MMTAMYIELFVFVLFVHFLYVQVSLVRKVMRSECGELAKSADRIATTLVAGLVWISNACFVGVLTMLVFFTLNQQLLQAIMNVVIMWGSSLVIPVIVWKAVVEPRLARCSACEQNVTL